MRVLPAAVVQVPVHAALLVSKEQQPVPTGTDAYAAVEKVTGITRVTANNKFQRATEAKVFILFLREFNLDVHLSLRRTVQIALDYRATFKPYVIYSTCFNISQRHRQVSCHCGRAKSSCECNINSDDMDIGVHCEGLKNNAGIEYSF